MHLRAVAVEDIVRAGLHRAETVTRDHRVVVAIDDGLPPALGRRRVDHRSDLHPARQREQVRAGGDDDHDWRVRADDDGEDAGVGIGRRAWHPGGAARAGVREVLPGARPRVARSAPRRRRPRAAYRPAAGRGAGRPHLDSRRPRASSGTTVVVPAAGRVREHGSGTSRRRWRQPSVLQETLRGREHDGKRGGKVTSAGGRR